MRDIHDQGISEVVAIDCCCYYSRAGFSLSHSLDCVGEKLVNFLVEPKKGTKWPVDLPRFESRQAAIDVCKDLCKYQFMHRSEKRGKGDLVVR